MSDDHDNPEDKKIRVKKGDRIIEIDKAAPGIHGKRAEFGLAGDARKDRAPGESGRGDLSDTDRVGSHGQGLDTPDERGPRRDEDE
jgi:hypothetical protein